jgi:nucleotide-binding universal stress UspA family protein
MYNTILAAIALQRWDEYTAHALAVRDVAASLAQGGPKSLHVLSVYDYEFTKTSGLPNDMAVKYREDLMQRTDTAIARKMDDYIAPLQDDGLQVTTLLRVGNPRELVVQVANDIKADILLIGTHSKRGMFDISMGGTAHQINRRAPCTVLLVTPHK